MSTLAIDRATVTKNPSQSQHVQYAAVDQRFAVVCKALGIEETTGPQRFVQFVDQLKQRQTSKEQAIYVLGQLFLARILRGPDIDSLSRHYTHESSTALVKIFVEGNEFLNGNQDRIHFDFLAEQQTIVDVSHTMTYAHNSGIQRVVRCMATQMRDANLKHCLVELDPAVNNYRLCDDAAKRMIYDWENTREVPKKIKDRQKSKLKIRLEKLAGRRLRNAISATCSVWRNTFRAIKRSLRPTEQCVAPTPKSVIRVLFVWDNRLVLPELIAEPWRVQQINTMLTNTHVQSTLVMYDLIPLHHPEFCVVSEGYINYLMLLRNVDRISCISQAIEQDLRSLMPLIDRSKPMPLIDTHYLGADFLQKSAPPSAKVNVSEISEVVREQDDLPLVLSVGTIEIRKNHRRMLNAMVAAQDRGLKFKGIFAGNPGWLNEDFLAQLKYFQERGYNVEWRKSVSEAELTSLYKRAAFTMYCSLVEGFGLPIVESVMSGVPCVVSRRGCMQEVAEQVGACVLVDPESETEMTDQIALMLSDKKYLTTLRQQAAGASWPSWRDYANSIYQFVQTPNIRLRKTAPQRQAA